MRKTTLLKSLLLLCALIVGSSAWADPIELISWSRSGTTDKYSSGFTFAPSAKASAKEGFYQDSGTKNSTIVSIALYHPTNKLFESTPESVTFTAKLGGGSVKDPLDYNVFACYVDKDGNDIEGTEVTLTTKITDKNGSDFPVSMSTAKATEAYGVKIYHMKEDSWNVRYYGFSLSYVDPSAAPKVSTPTFSPEEGAYITAQNVTIACETEGATIYYTTDGTDPTTESEVYSDPINVSATTTIKAFAAKAGNTNSSIASATYTFPTTIYNTIAELKAAAPTEPVILNLTNAQVLGVGTSDMYIKDASEGLDLYTLGLPYTAGQMLNGKVAVKTYKLYNGIAEITAIGENQIVASDGTLPTATVLANGSAATLEDYAWQFVTVTGTTTNIREVDGLAMYTNLLSFSTFMKDVDNITATGLLIPYQKNNAGDVVPELLPISIICHITLSKDMETYCSNNKLDFTGTGLTVYSAKVEEGVAKLTEVTKTKVSNKNGMILSGTAGQKYDVPVITDGSSSPSNNELVGVVAETAVAYTNDGTTKFNYILQDGVFKKATGAKLKAGKAYLSTTYDVTAATGAARLNIVIDGEATGIKAIENQKANSQMFDLQGRRVAQPTKGLYIVNGKKILVK